jgi:uncharacterized membrane protein HdeD (DUF308 family)
MISPTGIEAADRRATAGRGTGWQTVWGVLLVVAGILAVLIPTVAAVAKVLVVAALLLVGGAFEIFHALQTRHAKGFGWRLISGILTVALGILLLVRPLTGVAALALLVAAFFLAGGIARSILAFQLKPLRGWGWILFDGLLSIALAVLIAISWPQSSFAVIGILVGLWLIAAGIWRIVLARAVSATS